MSVARFEFWLRSRGGFDSSSTIDKDVVVVQADAGYWSISGELNDKTYIDVCLDRKL